MWHLGQGGGGGATVGGMMEGGVMVGDVMEGDVMEVGTAEEIDGVRRCVSYLGRGVGMDGGEEYIISFSGR